MRRPGSSMFLRMAVVALLLGAPAVAATAPAVAQATQAAAPAAPAVAQTAPAVAPAAPAVAATAPAAARAMPTAAELNALPAPVPGSVLSDRTASYSLEARLDPDKKRLAGRETITWVNRSPSPVSEVQLHLYWNAFKNQRSSFMREMGAGGVRYDAPEIEADEWGAMDVTSFQSDGLELKDRLTFLQPDDANPEDQTVALIPLASPVAPGATATFSVTFDAKIPAIVARSGFYHDFFLIGQWFPKLGVLEPAGDGLPWTWNCHQYHLHSEFYADFGRYDATLTVPAAFKVAATGRRVGATSNPDGTITYRYQQDDVVDFVWTAWPGFVETEATFDEPGLPKVDLHVLVPAEEHETIDLIIDAARLALRYYGKSWFPYPYAQLTLVSPPFNANEAGGMEYPTFITVGGELHPAGIGIYALYEVTIHELGHQYWQSMLASNEFEEAWLDEGINSYGTSKAMLEGDIAFETSFRPVLGYHVPSLPIRIDAVSFERIGNVPPQWTPILTPAWQFLNGMDYGLNNYPRVAMMLETLEAWLGPETMARVMRAYARRYAFHHPTSEDFFATAEAVSGRELGWFFDQFVRGTARLDYAVTEIEVVEIGDEQGYFDRDGKRILIDAEAAKASKKKRDEAEKARKSAADGATPGTVGSTTDTAGSAATTESAGPDAATKSVAAATAAESAGAATATESPGPDAATKSVGPDAATRSADAGTATKLPGAGEATKPAGAAADPATGPKRYRSRVLVERLEDGWMPVTVRVRFKDGSTTTEQWDGRSRWKRFVYEGTKEVVAAEVDPDRKLWLDRSWLNNGRRREADPLPPVRTGGFLLHFERLVLTLLPSLL